jgi:isocitrate dehydrogenase
LTTAPIPETSVPRPDWAQDMADLHVHAAPSLLPRHGDDRTTVVAERAVGFSTVVLKAHEGSTVERAAVAGDGAFGGIVLNSYARQHPGQRAISVDKASVFATSRLWRRTAHQVAAASGIPFADVNVDRAAYELVAFEQLPSVIVTEGIFGDILSDVVCARAGSPALCGSATINPDRAFGRGATGLFEPAHGSSPHRTGSRRSNPTGAWLALADLLAWCPDLAALGLHTRVRRALDHVLDHAAPTYDLAAPGAETIGLDEFNDRVLAALAAPLEARR